MSSFFVYGCCLFSSQGASWLCRACATRGWCLLRLEIHLFFLFSLWFLSTTSAAIFTNDSFLFSERNPNNILTLKKKTNESLSLPFALKGVTPCVLSLWVRLRTLLRVGSSSAMCVWDVGERNKRRSSVVPADSAKQQRRHSYHNTCVVALGSASFFFAVDVTWPHFFLVFYLSDAARNSEKDARSFSLCVVTHAQGPMHGRDRLLNAVNTQRSSTLAMCTLYTYVWLSYSLHGNLYVIHMQEKGISNTAFLFKGENKKALWGKHSRLFHTFFFSSSRFFFVRQFMPLAFLWKYLFFCVAFFFFGFVFVFH